MEDAPKRLALDHDDRSFRYYRNAVERHWDPGEVDLATDADRLREAGPEVLGRLRVTLAKFGAGEQAVTEDLAPLAQVLESVEDQMFVTTQLYEEAKHTDFFDRYWREVVHPVEDDLGLERTSPTDEKWFNEPYDELFARNEAAMERLLTEDTPENRARAYSHYHLTIEGILAQTGYFGLSQAFSDEGDDDVPYLPGLVEGLSLVRQDEGRHVGFGMSKLKELVNDGVDPELLGEVTDGLLPLVQNSIGGVGDDQRRIYDEQGMADYAAEKHAERLEQITASADLPSVEELTSLES